MPQRNPDLVRFESLGIRFDGVVDFIKPEWKTDPLAMDMALDAQPTLITTANSAIPAYLANFIDPDIIKVLLAPNKGAEILGEAKKGSFADVTATFPIVEYASMRLRLFCTIATTLPRTSVSTAIGASISDQSWTAPSRP